MFCIIDGSTVSLRQALNHVENRKGAVRASNELPIKLERNLDEICGEHRKGIEKGKSIGAALGFLEKLMDGPLHPLL